MDHLERGVLDRVGNQFGGDLLGDHQPLAVRADLRQHAGEQLHRVRAGPALAPSPEQPVRLLDDDDVAQSLPQPRPGPQPQVLDDPDDQRTHEEGLVLPDKLGTNQKERSARGVCARMASAGWPVPDQARW